jgi:hypothetical protein
VLSEKEGGSDCLMDRLFNGWFFRTLKRAIFGNLLKISASTTI